MHRHPRKEFPIERDPLAEFLGSLVHHDRCGPTVGPKQSGGNPQARAQRTRRIRLAVHVKRACHSASSRAGCPTEPPFEARAVARVPASARRDKIPASRNEDLSCPYHYFTSALCTSSTGQPGDRTSSSGPLMDVHRLVIEPTPRCKRCAVGGFGSGN